MKILILTLALAAYAEEPKGRTQAQAEDIARLVTRPVAEVVRPAAIKAVAEGTQWSNAGAWALWDLANAIAEQQKTGKTLSPSLVETYIRLRMRCNNADLCAKPGAACKAYPGDAEFAAAVGNAMPALKAYAAALKGRSPLTRAESIKINGLLDTARKRAIFSLPKTSSNAPQPGPVTTGEDSYRRVSQAKKQGDRFTLPPWK